MIEIQHINKSYGSLQVLRDINGEPIVLAL